MEITQTTEAGTNNQCTCSNGSLKRFLKLFAIIFLFAICVLEVTIKNAMQDTLALYTWKSIDFIAFVIAATLGIVKIICANKAKCKVGYAKACFYFFIAAVFLMWFIFVFLSEKADHKIDVDYLADVLRAFNFVSLAMISTILGSKLLCMIKKH